LDEKEKADDSYNVNCTLPGFDADTPATIIPDYSGLAIIIM